MIPELLAAGLFRDSPAPVASLKQLAVDVLDLGAIWISRRAS
jgi:hypothetical protein